MDKKGWISLVVEGLKALFTFWRSKEAEKDCDKKHQPKQLK